MLAACPEAESLSTIIALVPPVALVVFDAVERWLLAGKRQRVGKYLWPGDSKERVIHGRARSRRAGQCAFVARGPVNVADTELVKVNTVEDTLVIVACPSMAAAAATWCSHRSQLLPRQW